MHVDIHVALNSRLCVLVTTHENPRVKYLYITCKRTDRHTSINPLMEKFTSGIFIIFKLLLL